MLKKYAPNKFIPGAAATRYDRNKARVMIWMIVTPRYLRECHMDQKRQKALEKEREQRGELRFANS